MTGDRGSTLCRSVTKPQDWTKDIQSWRDFGTKILDYDFRLRFFFLIQRELPDRSIIQLICSMILKPPNICGKKLEILRYYTLFHLHFFVQETCIGFIFLGLLVEQLICAIDLHLNVELIAREQKNIFAQNQQRQLIHRIRGLNFHELKQCTFRGTRSPKLCM